MNLHNQFSIWMVPEKMKIKYGTLAIGVPLVAFGTRFLCQGYDTVISSFIFGFGLILLLLGQTIVRFEDFPFTRKQAGQLETLLSKNAQSPADN